ncbi:FxLYD domain-containing protein [Streptomyces sp. NPDC056470]|uniref:FxLYD domain-containing protein n=1 Tax=unclassified Streptomyces TaxID=2593676 RepID=UPI0036B1202E
MTGARTRTRPCTRTRTRTRAVCATALLALTVAVTGCTEESKQTAEDIVSSATAAAASAAQEKMNQVKDGVNATDNVKAGATQTDGDRTTAEITATNPTDRNADYTVWVNFRDSDGNLLDAAVLNIDGVEPGGSKTGTARSNRSLSGETKAEIQQALRH